MKRKPTETSGIEGPTKKRMDGLHLTADETINFAKNQVPFSDEELDRTLTSLKNLASEEHGEINWGQLRDYLATTSHISHKDWPKTELAALRLKALIKGPGDSQFQKIFKRVLDDGHWYEALEVHQRRETVGEKDGSHQPWIVLVSGLNGIRKTTSVYQSWFRQCLKDALGNTFQGTLDELPDGSNSFFRQLDYIIATIANEDFKKLYTIKSDDIGLYSKMKDAIFQRYRKVLHDRVMISYDHLLE